MSTKTFGTALVTGASSGIGAVYADRLARRGYDLILVARSKDKLDALAKHIAKSTGRDVRILAADLTLDVDLRRVEQLIGEVTDLTLLVNNAGVGATAPLLQADVGKMTDLIALNVTAPTRLAYAAVPGFVARGNGAVVNISSIVAIAPELLNGVYGGSKAFVLALTQSMHHELADKGVKVQAVLPGATATDFWPVAGSAVENLPKDWVMSAEDMVDASLAGFDAGELVTIPSVETTALVDGLEAARRALFPELSKSVPASRYGVETNVAA
ncbi:MAG TPA: SDR family oxidoreductase [Luteibacter sp.]|uniref:SDR family NAD(P)-dependent oxidoreductase n=1 Tax=Luteibacter sp. TaxID=1886636 RepID=UPI002CA291A4|nr:SDR family oxidoreductase [Luteibacter sp.]HVI56731.1 SDR family oxidoreductase [Luteibacter sp.]